jgi:Ti-type conjugative transfer relaxase TraA
MNIRIQTGKGVTGALRYVQGEGRDPKTGKLIDLAPGAPGRAELVGGTGFGFEVTDAARADLARRIMEFAAQNQGSKTRKCIQDCVHIELSWARGETPSHKEMMEAARSALQAQGMGNAMALVYRHKDEDYAHVHIVASKINPDTRRAYDLLGSWRKGSAWAEQWERDHGGVINTRRETANELRRAIRERDVEGVLTAITKQRSTFTQQELQRAVNKEIYPKIGSDEKRTVELARAQFMNAVLAHPEIVQLRDAAKAGPTTRYTTRTVLEAEIYVLNAAAALKENAGHGISDEQRTAVLAGKYSTMTAEQLQAFRHCTGNEGLALIDGQAGTGKSFTMAAIRDAYEAAGHHVIGLAFTNKVVKNLADDGFRHAATVHRELIDLNNGRTRWNPKTVVMVDEAAVLDTKLMAMVTAHARDAGAKLILAGDDRQLSSIDRGGMFGVLKDRHGAAVLSEVKRQHKIDDRRASEMMAEGNFHDALGIYERKGAINWTLTQKEAREELVEKWARDTAADRDKSRLVLAYTNDDVDRLNLALRAVRKERGELEWEDHTIKTAHGRFDFSAGDCILFTGTDKRLGVINKATGTIEAIDNDRIAVRLDGPERKIISLDAGSFNQFRHAYAATIYAAQGSNLDQVYLYHSEHWRSAPAYVALTRHKDKTELFVARNTAKDLKELAQQVSRTAETRAASQFYQQQPIGPVRPMKAPEILAHFAGEHIARGAERMQREARHWPLRHYTPRPHPPWPSLRERRGQDRDDAIRPRAAAVNENLRARMERRAQQHEGTGRMDDWWDEEKRKRRGGGGGGMEMEARPREPRQPPDTPDRDPAEQGFDHERAVAATEILAQQNNSQATYSIGHSQGGYAVFRTWDLENEMVAQLDLPASQQKLGEAPTLGELHAAIIDGSALTAASEWVTEQRIEPEANIRFDRGDDINQVAKQEKPDEPVIRLYRGIGNNVSEARPEDALFFSTDPARAATSGKLHYVDVTAAELAKFEQPHSERIIRAEPIAQNDWKTADPEIIARLKPLELEREAEPTVVANQNERELDPFSQRLRDGFSSFQGSEPAPGRYDSLQPAPAEPLTAEAIARDLWNAVALDLPADADPRLLFLVADTARGLHLRLSDRAGEALGVPDADAATRQQSELWSDLAGRAAAREKEAETLIRDLSPNTPLSKEALDYDPWAAVYQQIPADTDTVLLNDAYGMAVQCAETVASPQGPAPHAFEPTILYGTDRSREENYERTMRRIEELDARLQSFRQEQREFSLESIRDDPWSAVDLEIPVAADHALLIEAHATVVQCCQAVSRPPSPFDIHAPDNGQTQSHNLENGMRRLEELGDRLQAGLEPSERVRLAEDILDWHDDMHSHYDIAPWQDGFAVFRIYEIDDEMLEEYRLPTGQQLLGCAETLDQLHDAIIDGSALTASPQWVTEEQMIEADERYMAGLAEAADNDRRESINEDRSSSDQVDELRQAREEITEDLYDRDTGERLDGSGRDREAGHGLGGGLSRAP